MNRMLVTQWKICSKMFFRTVSKGILWLVYEAAAHFRGISAMFFPAEICSSYVYTCHYCKLKRRLKPLESIPFLPYFALSFVHTIRKQVKALFLYKWCHSTRFSDPIFTHIRNEHILYSLGLPRLRLSSPVTVVFPTVSYTIFASANFSAPSATTSDLSSVCLGILR